MILLSFDIEEFDLPTEYGLAISWEEQLRVSREGSGHILNVLARHGVRATFFCTTRFAEAAPDTRWPHTAMRIAPSRRPTSRGRERFSGGCQASQSPAFACRA